MQLSIIIPAYNEEERLGATLEAIKSYFDGRKMSYEVIVVDDGSDDNTLKIAEESGLADSSLLKVISNGENKGKGFSVRQGFKATAGEYVLICDADMSAPIEEVEKLIKIIAGGCDVVIGSRSSSDSDVRTRQPWYREGMGRIFNLFVKLTLGLRAFNDTQCGFKLLKGDIARGIAGDLKINGFSFDVEMLYLVQKKGYKIKEVGVIWSNSPQSKVKVIASSKNMFFDLLNIKKIHRE